MLVDSHLLPGSQLERGIVSFTRSASHKDTVALDGGFIGKLRRSGRGRDRTQEQDDG